MGKGASNGSGQSPGPARHSFSRRITAGAASYAARNRRSLGHLLTGELPSDVRDEEFMVAACFRASLVLNALTGGEPEMTFSARSHLNHVEARWAFPWLAWGLCCLVIDLACAALRGESEHCVTAWENHCARGGVAEGEGPLGPLTPSALTEV
ncbi:MAG: hypothetical protein AAGC57_10900 [Pseudomonadota bacterium]